jgi:hypothetical protein
MRLDSKQWATTDDLGQYRIADLSKGPYILMIVAEMLAPRKRLTATVRGGPATKHMTMARTGFYPGVESLDAASPIMLSQGMEYSGADIVVPQVDSFCMRTLSATSVAQVQPLKTIGTRRILHQNVTAHPTAEWTLQQLREALPGDHPYQVRDPRPGQHILEAVRQSSEGSRRESSSNSRAGTHGKLRV